MATLTRPLTGCRTENDALIDLDALPQRDEPTSARPSSGRKELLEPVGIWLASRVVLISAVLLGGLFLGTPKPGRISGHDNWILERLVWWDSFHFLRISDVGYLSPGRACCDQAFFPGYPLIIRVVAPVTGGPERAALLITLVCGAVAAVLLWQIAVDRARSVGSADPRRAGRIAVVFLSVAPYGIFLSAAYSETLFLALALGAWRAGSHRRWWWAGLLLAGATAVRVNGAILTTAMGVMYLEQLWAERRRFPRPDALALGAPVLVIGSYFTWLHDRTGSWTAWHDAEVKGWDRRSAWPWQGLQIAWDKVLTAPTHHLALFRAADIAAVLLGLTFVVVLLVLRRWSQAVFLGMSIGVVACSTVWVSTPRYALSWFPVFLLVTEVAQRPRWRWSVPVLVAVCLPAQVFLGIAFSQHLWVA